MYKPGEEIGRRPLKKFKRRARGSLSRHPSMISRKRIKKWKKGSEERKRRERQDNIKKKQRLYRIQRHMCGIKSEGGTTKKKSRTGGRGV